MSIPRHKTLVLFEEIINRTITPLKTKFISKQDRQRDAWFNLQNIVQRVRKIQWKKEVNDYFEKHG